MSKPTPLWREMLAASEEALRGREFVGLEESDLSTLNALNREIIKAIKGDQM